MKSNFFSAENCLQLIKIVKQLKTFTQLTLSPRGGLNRRGGGGGLRVHPSRGVFSLFPRLQPLNTSQSNKGRRVVGRGGAVSWF